MLNLQPSGNFKRCITLQKTKNLIFGIIMLSWLTNCTNMIVCGELVSEAKPSCKGEPLELEVFSKKRDVGFMRDVCVDIVARNVYNKLNYPVAKSCQKLANTKTATCSDTCVKWKRSSRGITNATSRINTQAEALMVDLLKVVWNDYAQKSIEEEFLFDCVNDAQGLLIDSAATTKDSKIIGYMEDLKKILCRRCALSESKDLMTAISMFIRNFKLKTGAVIVNYYVNDNVTKKNTLCGLIRLKFLYKKGLNTYDGQVIIKIPSLAPLYHTQVKDMKLEVQEALFYTTILPALYKLGQCKPFAPKLYGVTPEKVLILEDLSIEGYKNRSDSESFDLNHCQISLKILAMYHAFSYKYIQNFNENDPAMELIRYQFTLLWKSSRVEFDALCKLVKPFLNQSLHTKIVQLEETIIAEFARINYNDENSMKVIIHGDFHIRNLLFKYDTTGKVSQAKIIDWQLGREASPVLDLIEFFIDDINIDIIGNHEDNLLDSYLTTLNNNLALVSANRQYSRSELDSDMAYYKYYIIRLLSQEASNCLNQNAETCEKFQTAKKIAKWMIYLQEKGFLES